MKRDEFFMLLDAHRHRMVLLETDDDPMGTREERYAMLVDLRDREYLTNFTLIECETIAEVDLTKFGREMLNRILSAIVVG